MCAEAYSVAITSLTALTYALMSSLEAYSVSIISMTALTYAVLSSKAYSITTTNLTAAAFVVDSIGAYSTDITKQNHHIILHSQHGLRQPRLWLYIQRVWL